MDNPQTKTDELINKLDKHNYSVDSLQVLAWEELRHINSDKDFINGHREKIRQNRLTKLDEVGYLIQLVGELNEDQSTDLKNKISQLEETKRLCDNQSKKLRQQINYTDNLLEQVVAENSELLETLKGKGLSEKEISKYLKQKQLINTKDDTIQRLQTALENARRELDTIHRARSRSPALSTELEIAGIPSIVVTEARSIEEQGQEFLSKVKTVLKNAKKAGSREYTAETKSRKLAELQRYKQSFDKLGITDVHVLEDFRTSIETAENILARQSNSPLSELQDIRMPALSEITKIVNNTVPTFFGTEGPDLSSEVFRYIQGCKMVERELLSQENNGLTQDILQCLKLRLMGSAYSKLSQSDFSSVDAFCDKIKKLYLKKKNIDQIRELITNSKQSVREPASKFGERLESLLREAIDVINSEWPEETGRNTMITDFRRIAVRSFIKGLRDQALKVRFIGQENRELNSLISLVEEAEELLGEGQHNINTMSSLTPCSFCSEQGHERLNCNKRLNTPYCINCGIYGHEVGPRCGNESSKQVTCGYCRKRGHTAESCRQRLASLYCRVCRTTGHQENQFCGQYQRNTQNRWGNNQPINPRIPSDRNFEQRNIQNQWQNSRQNNTRIPLDRNFEQRNIQNEWQNSRQNNTRVPPDRNNFEKRKDSSMEKDGNRNRTEMCYKCGHPGHFARACVNNDAPRSANYSRARKNPENNSGNANRPSYSQ